MRVSLVLSLSMVLCLGCAAESSSFIDGTGGSASGGDNGNNGSTGGMSGGTTGGNTGNLDFAAAVHNLVGHLDWNVA